MDYTEFALRFVASVIGCFITVTPVYYIHYRELRKLKDSYELLMDTIYKVHMEVRELKHEYGINSIGICYHSERMNEMEDKINDRMNQITERIWTLEGRPAFNADDLSKIAPPNEGETLSYHPITGNDDGDTTGHPALDALCDAVGASRSMFKAEMPDWKPRESAKRRKPADKAKGGSKSGKNSKP